eukprot:scaffold341_cov368-Pavlova_lutheri.AAC.9
MALSIPVPFPRFQNSLLVEGFVAITIAKGVSSMIIDANCCDLDRDTMWIGFAGCIGGCQ